MCYLSFFIILLFTSSALAHDQVVSTAQNQEMNVNNVIWIRKRVQCIDALRRCLLTSDLIIRLVVFFYHCNVLWIFILCLWVTCPEIINYYYLFLPEVSIILWERNCQETVRGILKDCYYFLVNFIIKFDKIWYKWVMQFCE